MSLTTVAVVHHDLEGILSLPVPLSRGIELLIGFHMHSRGLSGYYANTGLGTGVTTRIAPSVGHVDRCILCPARFEYTVPRMEEHLLRRCVMVADAVCLLSMRGTDSTD